MSVGSSSKQYTSPLETSPLLTSLGSELACYRGEEEVVVEEEGSKAKKIDRKIQQTGAQGLQTHLTCVERMLDLE